MTRYCPLSADLVLINNIMIFRRITVHETGSAGVVGRPALLSPEAVRQLTEQTTGQDVRIHSTQRLDWPAKLHQFRQDEETASAYALHRAPRVLAPMSASSAVKYRRQVAPVDRNGYDACRPTDDRCTCSYMHDMRVLRACYMYRHM